MAKATPDPQARALVKSASALARDLAVSAFKELKTGKDSVHICDDATSEDGRIVAVTVAVYRNAEARRD